MISQKDEEEAKQIEEEDKDEETVDDKQEEATGDAEPDMWEETFKSHTDSKPKGWHFQEYFETRFSFSFFVCSSVSLHSLIHLIITFVHPSISLWVRLIVTRTINLVLRTDLCGTGHHLHRLRARVRNPRACGLLCAQKHQVGFCSSDFRRTTNVQFWNV